MKTWIWWCNVQGIFHWHTLDTFINIVHPSSDGCSQTGFLNRTMSSLKWPPRHQNTMGCGGMEIFIRDVHAMNLQEVYDAIISIWTKFSEECFQHFLSMSWRLKAALKVQDVHNKEAGEYKCKSSLQHVYHMWPRNTSEYKCQKLCAGLLQTSPKTQTKKHY